ncbi:MAG: hypothetical protein ACRC7C_15975, partial [Beijerinckiaceae bacterium]
MRPFHEASIRFSGWRRECDTAVQNGATLRAGAIAALMTIGLVFGPQVQPSPAEASRITVAAKPELVSVKNEERFPGVSLAEVAFSGVPFAVASKETTASETTASFGPMRRGAPGRDQAEAPVATALPIAVVDGVTLKAGDMLVRLASISPPATERMCKRLD